MSNEVKVIQTVSPNVEDVCKSVDEEQRLFTGVVLRPNVVDAHGDIYDEDVVKQAAYDYMRYCMNSNAQHVLELEKSDMVPVESYIAPCDIKFTKGEAKKGDWILTTKILNDTLWEMVKEGKFTGFSVGVPAMLEELSNES